MLSNLACKGDAEASTAGRKIIQLKRHHLGVRNEN